MKPIELTMQSFGSYGGKTVIDFTKPEQNLFLITGDTGSGKSTIFDAIVFALYGETGSKANKKDGKELQSQFSDGMKETFVRLVFSERKGSEINEYTVLREPRQTRISASGRKSDISERVTLILPDGTALSQKEADTRLSEIIVLTKSQFMQVSMIAQGEFMELLRASSNDKKKILRKLFSTDIFEKIVEELKSRRKSVNENIKYIRNVCQAEASHIIIPDDYKNTGFMNNMKSDFINCEMSALGLENFVNHLGTLCSDMEERKVSAERKHREAIKNSEKKRDILKSGISLLQCFEEMDRAEKELSECEKAEPEMKRKSELIRKIVSAYEIQAVYNRYSDISVSYDDAVKKLEYQKNIMPELEREHTGLVAEEKQALEVKNSAMTEFAQTTERVKSNLEIFGKIARAEKDIASKRCAVSEAEKRADSISGKIAELERNIAECQKCADGLPAAEKLLMEWQVRNDETERISADYQTALNMCGEISSQREKAEKCRSEYVSARSEYISVMTMYTEKRNAFLDAQAGFIAREKLRAGQPCPVCGSLEHPKPCVIPDIHRKITRDEIDRLAKKVSELDSIQNEKSAQTSSATEILIERERNFSTAMTNLRERMAKIIPDVDVNPDIEQAGKILSEWKARITADGKILSENVVKCRKASEMLKKYSGEKNIISPELERIKADISELQAEISGSVRLKNELTGSLFYTDEDSAHRILSVAEKNRDEKISFYNSIKSRLDSLTKNLEQARTLIKKYSEELPEFGKTLAERRAEYTDIVEKYSLSEWQEITGSFGKNEADILRSEIEAHSRRKLSAQTAYKLSEKSAGNNKRPDIEEMKKACASATEELETAQKNLDRYKEICRADSNVYELLSGHTEDYRILCEKYEDLHRLYTRLSGIASGSHIGIETFVQRYYLQRILDNANVHFRRMSGGQFELRLMDEKQASSTGRTERGLDLMVYSDITGKEREVRTLSGGEMFMSALSLALGMSEQIQENATSVNPDIMFIDEGFGSLDEHSRNQAVRVLREMAEENRFIGIISHVTEMKQEIDSQLVITKDKNGSHADWLIN